MIERRKPLPRPSKPLKRTELRRSSKPLKRTAIKSSSSKSMRKARPNDRLATWCEASTPACDGRAQHRHHKRGRVGPDVDEREHTLDVCLRCHEYIHAHPAESYEAGWLERRT